MKRIALTVCALLLTASLSFAGAIAENDQFQAQGDGGFAVAVPGVSGHIGGAGGAQLGGGYSAASPGDLAYEYQTQTQTNNDFAGADDGNGNFSAGGWATEQTQIGGSIASGGVAGQGGAQGMVGGSAGLSVGGQFGVAGSAGAAGAIGGSGALGGAAAGQLQYQSFDGAYEQQSVGPNSYVYQEGSQTFGTVQGSGAAIIGAGVSGAGVAQAGGTMAANDGQATAMQGHGSAAGDASAFAASGGLAVAGAGAFGTQTHSYEQEAAVGGSYQGQSGTVHTTVTAVAID